MMAPDSMALAATAIASGVSCLCVTLGKRGAVYVAAPGVERLADDFHVVARRWWRAGCTTHGTGSLGGAAHRWAGRSHRMW